MRTETCMINELIVELAESGREIPVIVVTNSMLPLIAAGDRVTMKPVNACKVGIGDIVVFKLNDGFMVHRMIGYKRMNGERLIRHKGDSGQVSSLVPLACMVGKAIAVGKEGREIEIDTPAWRRMNYGIGLNMAIADMLIRNCGRIRRRLPVPAFIQWIAVRVRQVNDKVRGYWTKMMINKTGCSYEDKNC